jgi:hypothetical protein
MCRFPKAYCLLGFDNDLFFVTDRLVQADKNFTRVRFFVTGAAIRTGTRQLRSN